MSEIEQNIAAYEKQKGELETTNPGRWVVFHDRKLHGIYETFEAAAKEATDRFGRGPYLIHQIGSKPMVLPASVMFCPQYA